MDNNARIWLAFEQLVESLPDMYSVDIQHHRGKTTHLYVVTLKTSKRAVILESTGYTAGEAVQSFLETVKDQKVFKTV